MFKFHSLILRYSVSIVQNFSTFWVRLSPGSDSAPVELMRRTTPPPEGSINYQLVKAHGISIAITVIIIVQ